MSWEKEGRSKVVQLRLEGATRREHCKECKSLVGSQDERVGKERDLRERCRSDTFDLNAFCLSLSHLSVCCVLFAYLFVFQTWFYTDT